MTGMEVWGGNNPVNDSVAMAGLDAWVYCQPYRGAEGGGDVYYVSSCATGRITRLLVADVAGHGLEVSDTAAQLRALMRRYVNFLDQTQFVQSLNQKFIALSHGGRFATAIVSTFFGPTGHLTLCNAGHPPPLIYRARQRRWEFIQPHNQDDINFPWGIVDGCDYAQFDIQLAVDDLVLCYTDSLTEARMPNGELLGMDRLLALLTEVDVSNPQTLIANLLTTISKSGNTLTDDATVLLFRPNGRAKQAPFAARLQGLSKLVKALISSLHPSGPKMPWPDLNLANIGGAIIPRLNKAWSAQKKKRHPAT